MMNKRLWLNGLIIMCSVPLFVAVAHSQETDVRIVEAELLKKVEANIERHRKGDVTIAVRGADGVPVAGARVTVRQVSHDFLFGNYIRPRHYKDQRYLNRFKEVFNFVQLLEFNWGQYEPDEGKPLLEQRMDFIRDWGIPNGFETYYGHMLVWTDQKGEYPRTHLPVWLFDYEKQEQYRLLKQRIQREVTAYRDVDILWDVVNEPTHCRVWGDWDKDSYVQNRQAEPFERVMAYVTDALTWAHQANPEALLLINDYRVIVKTPFQRRFKRLVDTLVAQQVPLHAVGIQAHEPFKGKYWYSPQELWDAYEMFGTQTELPIYITEYFQVSDPSQAIRGDYRSGKWSEASQADAIEEFYRVSFGHPAVEAIIYFGLPDSDVVQPYCGLLAEDYHPKPVYNRLRKLIHEEWKTKVNMRTDESGTIAFRGFYGNYTVTLKTTDGRTRSFSEVLQRGQSNKWEFTVEGN